MYYEFYETWNIHICKNACNLYSSKIIYLREIGIIFLRTRIRGCSSTFLIFHVHWEHFRNTYTCKYFFIVTCTINSDSRVLLSLFDS